MKPVTTAVILTFAVAGLILTMAVLHENKTLRAEIMNLSEVTIQETLNELIDVPTGTTIVVDSQGKTTIFKEVAF